MNRRSARIIALWVEGKTGPDIAEEVGCSVTWVFRTLRKARIRGEIARRKHQAPAHGRRKKIAVLKAAGADNATIAAMLGTTERLVRMRVRELNAQR